MPFAIEIMNREPLRVSPNLPVPDLARMLLREGLDGVCVVDRGRLVGVVTTMDVVFQEKPAHLPTLMAVVDRLLPGGTKAASDLEKITGSTVADIMTRDPLTVAQDTSLSEIAGLMVDRHVTVVPVVEGDTLLGVIYKADVLRAAITHVRPR